MGKNKMPLEKIARLAEANVDDLQRILNEEKARRRKFQEAMFKGGRLPTDEELYQDRKVNNMSTCEIGIKYGKPGKPVSENTVVRWLKNLNIYDGKKVREGTHIPTKEELENDLRILGKKGAREKYHIRYERLCGLMGEYGIETKSKRVVQKTFYEGPANEDKPVKQKPERPEKQIIVKKRKTVLEKYLENEDDLSMENESGFDG